MYLIFYLLKREIVRGIVFGKLDFKSFQGLIGIFYYMEKTINIIVNYKNLEKMRCGTYAFQ